MSTRVCFTNHARVDSRPFASVDVAVCEHVNALGAIVHQPIEPIQQPLSRHRRTPDDVPVSVHQSLQPQRVRDRVHVHGASNVSLIREDQHARARQFFLLEHTRQRLRAVSHPSRVRAVHHPYQSIRRLVIISPVRSKRLLSPDVPHVERIVAVRHRLDVKPERRGDLVDGLPAHAFHDGGLPGVI